MLLENTPTLLTPRLILRRFAPEDLPAVFDIYSDREANRFLPWFPAETMADARRFLEERYLAVYERPSGYAYAVCRREDNIPIGYLHVDTDEPHDFGYGFRKAFWGQGYAAEAGAAVIARLKADGMPYITATHDALKPPEREGDGETVDALLLHLPGTVAAEGYPGGFPDVPVKPRRGGRPGLPGVLGKVSPFY